MLTEIGFVDIEIEEACDWHGEDWQALSSYSVFVKGALQPDIDLALGNAALRAGMRIAYDELELDAVKRAWFHCIGRKP